LHILDGWSAILARLIRVSVASDSVVKLLTDTVALRNLLERMAEAISRGSRSHPISGTMTGAWRSRSARVARYASRATPVLLGAIGEN